jgi:mRNA-degrading endonuclease RelE of RelBE toxin-antitoxin system
VQRLRGREGVWRHRVGPWRVFSTLNWERRIVTVTAIERRTSTTY